MNYRDQGPSYAQQLREATEKHELMLLRAAQTGRQVIHEAKYQFIHTIHGQQSGGSFEVEIYLTGIAKPVRPDQLQLAPAPAAHEKEADPLNKDGEEVAS
ncbi:hypothetical protein AB4Z32_27440 [Massilia sp. 2TAF26]|uniref:hypothetical protein n=1 Tax=Bacteria TaxID=2 RepID=UPI003F9AD148